MEEIYKTIIEEKRGLIGMKTSLSKGIANELSNGIANSRKPKTYELITELLKYCPCGLTGS